MNAVAPLRAVAMLRSLLQRGSKASPITQLARPPTVLEAHMHLQLYIDHRRLMT